MNGVTYTQTFDVENRLTAVAWGSQTVTFHYDADGNRILTVQPDGTKIYTPFPEYEETVPASGSRTEHSHYSLVGQYIAVRVRTGTTGDGSLYYAYADQQGIMSAWTTSAGAYIAGSLVRHKSYGNYGTALGQGANPDISDRGYTGQSDVLIANNTGDYDMGLIYINARRESYHATICQRWAASLVRIRLCLIRPTRLWLTKIPQASTILVRWYNSRERSMDIVVDTSILIAVVANESSKEKLIQITSRANLLAPVSVHFEFGNALSAMLKRKRIQLSEAAELLSLYRTIPVRFVDVELPRSLEIAYRFEIYAYDAYLIQCAEKYRSPLLTLDNTLRGHAHGLGVEVVEVPT
jgi:predicted nucleic acid-binding protein